ncbi:hypothetical protein [Microbacterium azadirachtae]|uniref:Uncharacterized protein n=1 Tax=Microbacterium azadirachtae TaxID=582680 RepID=A0A0F0LG33_9MICO|nr:hypothetical protein [Microbacterium azadirachtae]KJL31649.1 hypothetical protein RS86_02924 [Microbacterium azadirachtae]
MGFDGGEFASGAARAVALHVALFAIASVLLSLAHGVTSMIDEPGRASSALSGAFSVSMLVMIYAVPISLLALLIGVCPAYMVGRWMVRIPAFRNHLLAWCAFGIVFCGAVSFAVAHILHVDQLTPLPAFVIAGFVSGAAAIPLAWARTASLALRKDRGLKPLRWFRRRSDGAVSVGTESPGSAPHSDR